MFISDRDYCPGCMRPRHDGLQICECGFDETQYEQQSHCLQIGTVLDESIKLGKVIGHGGFGITYIAMDTNLLRRMAV